MRIKTLALLQILLLLAACGGPTSSGAVAPVALNPAVSATLVSESRLLIPENVPPGAATAIFEYFRLLNLALETGRTADLEELVAWDCPCLNPVPAIHAIYRDGLLIGAQYRIERISLISKVDSRTTIQVESVRTAATQVTTSTGARKVLAEHRNVTDFRLENFSDIWLIMSSKAPQ